MSDTGISLEATLPLQWESGPAFSPILRDQHRHANLSLLRALASIETVPQERDETPEAIRKHIDHIESKLDLLLTLVAKLSLDAIQLPPEHKIVLSQTQISWHPGELPHPEIGQAVQIRLFLSPRVPQPLILDGIVISIEAGEILATLQNLDEEMNEWLMRTIFRYHRRAVHARKQP